MNQVIGTCVSLGLSVAGEVPRTMLKTRIAARGAR